MTDIETLSPPTPDVIQLVRNSVGVDEERISEAKEQLRQWLERQPHLPHCIDDRRLENIYLRSKGSIERAKSSLDMYYTVRTALPEFFGHRDINDPWSDISKLVYYFPLPKLTDDGYRVLITGYIDPNTEKYSLTYAIKLAFMVTDLLLKEDYAAGDIIALDCKHMTFFHAAVFTPPMLRNLMTALLHGFNCRLKGIHVMNAPAFIIPVVNLLRSMIKPKIANRIFVDSEGYGMLSKQVSSKILPNEYQGEAGPLMDLWGAWMNKLHSNREWFLEDEKYKADESKRFEELPNRHSLFGSDGSFRQLSID